MKASSVAQPKKQAKEKPDLEEAIDESDDGEVVEEVKDEEEDVDLSKDKYVKQPKKKAAPKKGGKKKKDEGDDEDEEEVKPKGKGKAKRRKKEDFVVSSLGETTLPRPIKGKLGSDIWALLMTEDKY